MGMYAVWLSGKQKVVVLEAVEKRMDGRSEEGWFKVELHDGSIMELGRKDLLFQEEEKMINELAGILIQKINPAKSDRYFSIMHYLMERNVPYVNYLQSKLIHKPKQQALELSDVG